MSKLAVLITILLTLVLHVNLLQAQGMDLLDQQNNGAVEHNYVNTQTSSNGPATRYTFQREIKRLNPEKGLAFSPMWDGLQMPNSQVKVPATCLPGIGEGVCDGHFVSRAGACYGMVVVAANYYRRVVRRVAAGRPAITRWDARRDVAKADEKKMTRMLPLFQQHEDPSDWDGVNCVCKKVQEVLPNTKNIYKGDKKSVNAVRMLNVAFHDPIKDSVKGAALWHQIDQVVPGSYKRLMSASGEALHTKMEELRGRLNRHGLATIVWKHNGNRGFGHAFLLHAIHEVEVKRGGASTEKAWELRIYDPNKRYTDESRSKSCIYYLPERKRMTFSPELIKSYSKNGRKIQEGEFIDGNTEILAEITPEVWNKSFLAKTIVHKKERRYLREAASTQVD